MNKRQQEILKITELRAKRLPFLGEHLSDTDDIIGYILKCHLFTESILDDLIRLVLKENAEAVLSISLTYSNKLNLVARLNIVEGIELIPEYAVDSLRKLNQLRNRISHELGKTVTDSEIKELFMGLESELPYKDILEHGQKDAVKRYAAFIFGCLLPKFELHDETIQ